MSANFVTLPDHAAASRYAADWLAGRISDCPTLTATLAAGDTPLLAYQLLIEKARTNHIPLDRMQFIGLDEWIGLGPADAGSCIETLTREFYGPAGIPADNIDYFDGRAADPALEVQRVCDRIAESGGIDLIVVGVGVNGHIGFNEPGDCLTGAFSLVTLSETTLEVGRKYFGGGAAPETGATMTLETIRQAKNILIFATGERKRDAVQTILRAESGCPAAAFCNLPQAVYLFDSASNPQ